MKEHRSERQTMTSGASRRQFLRFAATVPFLGLSRRLLSEPPAAPGRVIRMRSPENLEMNFAGLNGFITPTQWFYVRNHFPAPKIDLKTWRLRIEGAVAKPLDLNYDQLQKLQSKPRPATHQSA